MASQNVPIQGTPYDPPPVPPKDSARATATTTMASMVRQRRPPPLDEVPLKELKALPPLPPNKSLDHSTQAVFKPLPAVPRELNGKSTLIWITGLMVWFFLVILLLPVFLEAEAMPGMNRILRRWGTTLLEKTRVRLRKPSTM